MPRRINVKLAQRDRVPLSRLWKITSDLPACGLSRMAGSSIRVRREGGFYARKKFVQHYFERGVITARITEFMHDLNLSAADIDNCETRLGSADVTCKNIFHGQVLSGPGDRRNLRTILPPILPSPVIANRINPPGNNSSSSTCRRTTSWLSSVSYTHLTLPTNREV